LPLTRIVPNYVVFLVDTTDVVEAPTVPDAALVSPRMTKWGATTWARRTVNTSFGTGLVSFEPPIGRLFSPPSLDAKPFSSVIVDRLPGIRTGITP
jgi:hypothetical protein